MSSSHQQNGNSPTGVGKDPNGWRYGYSDVEESDDENQQGTSNATKEINVGDEVHNILIDAELWVNNPETCGVDDMVFKTTARKGGTRKITFSNAVIDELALQQSIAPRKGYSGDVRDECTDLIVQRITVNKKYRRQGVATNLLTNLATSFDHIHLQQCISDDAERLAKSLIEKHGWYKQRKWLGGDLNVFSPVKKREPWWKFIIRKTMDELNKQSGACFVKSFEEQVQLVRKELEKHYLKYDYEHGKIEKCIPIWVSELSNSIPHSRTVNMFLQSGKMWHEPNLKENYEVMRSRETQMEWMRWKLFDKIFSNETRDVIKMVQAMWIKHYRRYLEPLGIADFISKLQELWQATHDSIKNDYYLETLAGGYDEDRYRKKFKCEPLTNPTYDEHDKKEREAFNKRNDWIRTIKYLETRYSSDYRPTPYDQFAGAYDDWMEDHEAPICPRGTIKKKRAIAEANGEPAAKKRKVEEKKQIQYKADKNPTGSNPHDVKSDMMKSGIAGENKGNQQMSGAPFYNDFEQDIVTEHIAKWPDDKPEDLGQLLASVQQGGGLITKSSTLEVMHRNDPVAGTFLLAYLLKAAKISIVLHSQLKEDNGRNVMCNIRDSSYLGFPASQFGLTEHCSVANFKLWIETKHFPAVCAINNETCILDFDITETGKVLKIFVCLLSDD